MNMIYNRDICLLESKTDCEKVVLFETIGNNYGFFISPMTHTIITKVIFGTYALLLKTVSPTISIPDRCQLYVNDL